MARCYRAMHGTALTLAVDAPDGDATLSWEGGSAAVTVAGGLCTIPQSVAAQVPRPANPLDHVRCILRWDGPVKCIDYLHNHSHHVLEARHRWQQT